MVQFLTIDLFKKEVLKSIFILCGVFVLATIAVMLFKGYHNLESFRKNVHLDRLVLEKDFYKIQSIYPSQLEYIKNEIKKIEFSKKSLRLYFHSHRTLLLNQSNANSLIVTDKERRIVYSDFHRKGDNDESNLEERRYLQSLEAKPDQIIFTNFTKIISNTPEGTLTMPIATGVVDNDNSFLGAIIITVSSESFSKNFLRGDLFSLSISDKSQVSEDFLDLNYFSQMYLLLFADQKISKTFYSKQINKQIDIKYQPDYYREKFIKKTIEGCIITALILITLFFFYYFIILNPLRPTISIINHLHGDGFTTFNRNLFNIVTSSLTKQSEIISEQQAHRNDQILQFSTMVSSISSMTNYIKTKIDFLIEDISDVSSDTKANMHAKKLVDIESAIRMNQQDINSVMVSFNHILDLLGSQKKENFEIKLLLMQSGVEQELFIEEGSGNDIEKMNYYQIRVYEVLFNTMIHEILGFTTDSRSLKSVEICSNSQVIFTFVDQSSNLTLNDNEKLTLCKMWALFNDIQITVEYNVKTIRIICHI